MNRFSITLAAATVSALALIVGAPVGAAHANTYTCNDTHDDWTLTTDLHSDKASFWPNTASSGLREGTYIVSEGFAIVKFSDGWLRIGPTGTGDWTIGKVERLDHLRRQGSASCREACQRSDRSNDLQLSDRRRPIHHPCSRPDFR